MQLRRFAALIAFATIANAQDGRPKSGVDIDETRTVHVSHIRPSACISIALDGATVFLDRAALELLAVGKPKSWTSEQERLALVAGRRAELLLAAVSRNRDASGCFSATSDTEFEPLIVQELERGNVVVMDAKSNKAVDVVHLRYLGDCSGQMGGRGYIMVFLPSMSHPFLVLNWWGS